MCQRWDYLGFLWGSPVNRCSTIRQWQCRPNDSTLNFPTYLFNKSMADVVASQEKGSANASHQHRSLPWNPNTPTVTIVLVVSVRILDKSTMEQIQNQKDSKKYNINLPYFASNVIFLVVPIHRCNLLQRLQYYFIQFFDRVCSHAILLTALLSRITASIFFYGQTIQ